MTVGRPDDENSRASPPQLSPGVPGRRGGRGSRGTSKTSSLTHWVYRVPPLLPPAAFRYNFPHEHRRSTRRPATPCDADPVRQRYRPSWPRCWSGWSCARRPTCCSFSRAIITTPAACWRSTNWRRTNRPACAAWSRKSNCGTRAPAGRCWACWSARIASTCAPCGSISLTCVSDSGEGPACCCPERPGSTAAGGKWSIRGWKGWRATARSSPGAFCRCIR